MTTKLIQAIIIVLVGMALIEGLPELSRFFQNIAEGNHHTSQYNLAFWVLVLIGLFTLARNLKWR